MILAINDIKEISQIDRYSLIELSERTTFDHKQKKYLSLRIYQCDTIEEYEEIERYLLLNLGGIDTVVNPSQKQINEYLKRHYQHEPIH